MWLSPRATMQRQITSSSRASVALTAVSGVKKSLPFQLEYFLLSCFVLLMFTSRMADCFACSSCDRSVCRSVIDCPGGAGPDLCGCCLECNRVENETCGGRYGISGKCDVNLVCVIAPEIGSSITGDEIGVCKVIPATTEKKACDKSNCVGSRRVPECPFDSVIVFGHENDSSSSHCCPHPPICQCQVCPSLDLPSCPTGHVRVLKSEGTFTPGNCCDVFECVEHSQFCDHIDCDQKDDLLFNTTCPEDSYLLPTLVSQDGCCFIQQGCACKSKASCEKLDKCPNQLQKRVWKPATGIPGSCCDQFDCINSSNPMCTQNGKTRFNGETWIMDGCTSCKCHNGLTFCEKIRCPNLAGCSWIGTSDNECCPKCKGCIAKNGLLYSNGARWQQDNCVTCHCESGEIFCQAQLCSITCSNPKTVPGECCLRCDEDTSVVTQGYHCPSLSNCSLMCSDGYKKGSDGCHKCQCSESMDEPCDMDCPNGFRKDLTGKIKVCECSDVSTSTLSLLSSTVPSTVAGVQSNKELNANLLVPCVPLMGCIKQCLYGYRTDKQGCQRCKCNKCPAFDCAKKCQHGFVHSADGCKLCKCLDGNHNGPTLVVPVEGRRCISIEGHQLDEGQSWWDGCRKCFCHQGYEMCALITCPVIRCLNPVMKPGSCCLSCGDELKHEVSSDSTLCHSIDGRYFVEGETWQLDECTMCICHRGSALCGVDNCPALLCNHPVILPHNCCPVCPEGLPTALSPWKNSQQSCQLASGVQYNSGDTWQVNSCQSCTCRDGQVNCYSQSCPISECNKTYLKKGQCCPVCLELATKFCTYDGDMYSYGETWSIDNCTSCTCSDGQVLCMKIVCSVLTCREQILAPGECCPRCLDFNKKMANFTKENSTDLLVKDVGTSVRHQATVVSLATVVVILVLVVILLFVLLLRRKSKQERVIHRLEQKLLQKVISNDRRSDAISPPMTCVMLSEDNLNLMPSSDNTESLLKSDDSLNEKSIDLNYSPSLVDYVKRSNKLLPSDSSLDYKNVDQMNKPDSCTHVDKQVNRHSLGDELEQSSDPTRGDHAVKNNRKSW